MKSTASRQNRHLARESRKIVIMMCIVALSVLAGGLLVEYMNSPQSSENQTIPSNGDVESEIRRSVVDRVVSSNREPVALYYRRAGMSSEQFCCVGTVFNYRDYGTVVMTSEHLFRTDLVGGQTIIIKPLRPSVHWPLFYMGRIVRTAADLGGNDAVMAKIGITHNIIQPFSPYVFSEAGTNFYGDVVIKHTKIPTLRSLVSGKEVRTIGYCQQIIENNNQVFVMIDYPSRAGQSGTGFIDDHDGLWILHASPEPDIALPMLEECRKLSHVTNVTAMSTVSGPFGGNYD